MVYGVIILLFVHFKHQANSRRSEGVVTCVYNDVSMYILATNIEKNKKLPSFLNQLKWKIVSKINHKVGFRSWHIYYLFTLIK